MSDVMRRIITVFDVQGAERVRAQLGMMGSGFQGTQRNMRDMNREAGLLDKQMRALGTTIRYMFAGGAVYGTMQMVNSLGQFESKLGDIAAIATGAGNRPLTNSVIDQLGQDLIRVSNDTAVPIADLEEGVQSLYSTIGNVPENKAVDLINTIATVAVTSQAGIEDTTQALLGMMLAFGGSTGDVKKFGDEFQRVIQLSTGGSRSGAILSQKLGVLSSAASQARFTPEQMMALAIGSSRFGGSPATNYQYLAQAFQSLINPTTKAEKAAFASIGLGPAQRARMSGWDMMMTVLNAVNRRGGVGINKQLASSLENQGDIEGTATGVQGGGAALLNSLFGRVQTKRMVAILSRQMPGTVGPENETLAQYLTDVMNSAGAADDAMKRAMDHKRIVQAANAMHNLGIETAQAFNPIFNLASKGIVPAVDAYSGLPWGARAGIEGGAVGAAVLALKLRGRGGGVGTLARGAIGVNAGLDALTQTQRGYSPLNPLYVAVVWNMGGGLPGGFRRGSIPGTGIPNRDMREVENEARRAEQAAARSSRLGRLGGMAKRLGGVGAILGGPLSVGAYIAGDIFFSNNKEAGEIADPQAPGFNRGSPGAQAYRAGRRGILPNAAGQVPMGHGSYDQATDPAYLKGLSEYQKTLSGAALLRFERTLRSLASGQFSDRPIKGQADVNVTVKDDKGKVLGKTSVTTDLFPDFTKPAPTTRAKSKTNRGT